MSKKMEKEFEKIAKKASEEIEVKLIEACKNLNEAIAISEKYGIPFSTGISFLPNDYVPTTMKSMYPNVSDEIISGVTNIYNDYVFDFSGWYHSDVC